MIRTMGHAIPLGFLLAALGGASTDGKPISIRAGEPVHAEMPFGDPYETRLTFKWVAERSGLWTVDVRSLQFPSRIEVLRVDVEGPPKRVAEDLDRSGDGDNARVVLEVQAGARYLIRVEPDDFPFCGGSFEVSITEGRAGPLAPGAEGDASSPYWEEVRREAERLDRPECRVRALLGRSEGLHAAGTYKEALAVAEEALSLAEASLGPEHLLVAGSLAQICGIHWYLRSEDTGLPFCERALATFEKKLGPDHPFVALALVNLGFTLELSNEYDQAMSRYRRALEIEEKQLAPDHLDIALTSQYLAGILSTLGEYSESRRRYEQALAVSEGRLGLDSPTVGAISNNFAVLLMKMGDLKGARRLYERAVASGEKHNGPDHPEVASALANLANVLRQMRLFDEARPLLERALAIREKRLGPDHPMVASSLNLLGLLLRDMGSFAEARPLLERALAIRERVLGADDVATAGTLHEMGVLLTEMGSFAEARPLFERALATRERVFGADHLATADTLNEMGGLLWQMGAYDEAKPILERALAVREGKLGSDHPAVADTLGSVGALLVDMGSFSEARAAHERSLAIREEKLDPDDPAIAVSLNNLGWLFLRMGAYAEARPVLERALGIREKALGPDSPLVAQSLSNLGLALKGLGDLSGAKPLLERALRIREAKLGPEHPRVVWPLNGLADLLVKMGRPAEARPLLERALAIREKQLGPEHPDVARSLDDLAELLAAMGSYDKAVALYKRALAILEKHLGPDDPRVAASLAGLAAVRALTGNVSGALEDALRAEAIGREHLRLTARSLPESQALHYASVRASGRDLALSILASGAASNPAAVRNVWDAVARSRALILDEVASRNRTAAEAGRIARHAERLASASTRLAGLVVRGPGNDPPEVYRKLLDDARREKEDAEEALARRSTGFRDELRSERAGLDEAVRNLPPGGALVAFVLHASLPIARRAEGTKAARPGSAVSGGAKGAGGDRVEQPAPSYLAFVLPSRGEVPVAVPLGPAGEIDRLISRWKEEAERGAQLGGRSAAEAENAYRDAGAALRLKVWDPIAAHVAGSQALFIVPDGALHLVSFTALPVEEAGYLLERGPKIHYLSAERDLLVAAGGRKSRAGGLLALGGPAFDETGLFAALTPPKGVTAPSVGLATIASRQAFRGERSGCAGFREVRFEPLPATVREVREITGTWEEAMTTSRWWSSSEEKASEALRESMLVLTGADATEGAFKAGAAGRQILHLATHGFFLAGRCHSALQPSRGIGGLVGAEQDTRPSVSGENPLLLSGLALAGANHRDAAGPEEEDGILTAEEIAALDLSGVEWAVLSACDTGVGEVQAGEGVFGLRRAFQVAGARTVIMSLWSVEDEAAREWMKALYEGRLLKHLDTADAVRNASLTLLRERQQKGLSTHPFYWAAFVAAGDWR